MTMTRDELVTILTSQGIKLLSIMLGQWPMTVKKILYNALGMSGGSGETGEGGGEATDMTSGRCDTNSKLYRSQ